MKVKLKDAFGVQAPDSVQIEIPELNTIPPALHQYLPRPIPNYLVRSPELKKLLLWRSSEVNILSMFVEGLPGAGKSSLFVHACGVLRWPLFRVACHDRMEVSDLIGDFVLASAATDDSGAVQYAEEKKPAISRLIDAVFSLGKSQPKMTFQYGALSLAMKHGGVLLLDEGNTLRPEVWMALHTVMDGEPLLIPRTGEVIQPHPSFRIVVTGNNGMHGDVIGIFKGVKRQNQASTRRLAFMKVSYMDPKEEQGLISKEAPELPEATVEAMVRLANDTRKLHVGHPSGTGDLENVLSTDLLVRWARLAVAFSSMKGVDAMSDSLNFANLDGWQEKDAVVVREMWAKIVGGTKKP